MLKKNLNLILCYALKKSKLNAMELELELEWN